jgi:hypothetical protein
VLPRRFLIELPADEPERARCFWEGLLETRLESRRLEDGRGWQAAYRGIVFGLHERGTGPRRPLLTPLLPGRRPCGAVEQVSQLGGEIIHPGERWVICRDSEGTSFFSQRRPGRTKGADLADGRASDLGAIRGQPDPPRPAEPTKSVQARVGRYSGAFARAAETPETAERFS